MSALWFSRMIWAIMSSQCLVKVGSATAGLQLPALETKNMEVLMPEALINIIMNDIKCRASSST